MLNYTENFNSDTLAININCDTIIAVNAVQLNLTEADELIFTLKNYDYKNSSYVFIFRGSKADIDSSGNIFIRVRQAASKRLKHGAFYSLAKLSGAFDSKQTTVYEPITSGSLKLIYGAQDLVVTDEINDEEDFEFVSVRLERIADNAEILTNPVAFRSEFLSAKFELIDEEPSVPQPPTEVLRDEIIGVRLEAVNI